MGAVSNLKPAESLESFLDHLYGNETGWAYLPTKALDLNGKSDRDGAWQEHYFAWPRQKNSIIAHVESVKKDFDVYISPALFAEPNNEARNVKGSYTFWVDFDGKTPTVSELSSLGIPHPTWRNCSSGTGHEHWFWRMPNFLDDLATLQDTNKALAYALGGDLGGWSVAKVLRPVSGINHKRNDEEVTILSRNSQFHSATKFASIPVPKDAFTEAEFIPMNVPNFFEVVCKYSFTDSDIIALLAKPTLEEGTDRSGALARLGYHCAELGMSNHEIFSVLLWKDKGWKKFYDRHNRNKCYIDLINHIRQKNPNDQFTHADDNKLKTYGYMSLIQHTDDTKWLIDGILPETGLLFVAGQSGTGKTLLTIDMCRELAQGRGRFEWKSETGTPIRIMMLSLEMPRTELKIFLEKGIPSDPSNQLLLEENFKFYAEPEVIKFYDPHNPVNHKLFAAVASYKPHILVVDSATVAYAKDLNTQAEVQASVNYLYRLRNELKFAMIVIAHTRKNPPSSGYRQKDLDDLFGSQALAASSSAVIGIQKTDEEISDILRLNITYLKTRFTGSSSRFQAQLNPNNLTFGRPVMGELASSLVTTAPTSKSEEKKNDGPDYFPI